MPNRYSNPENTGKTEPTLLDLRALLEETHHHYYMLLYGGVPCTGLGTETPKILLICIVTYENTWRIYNYGSVAVVTFATEKLVIPGTKTRLRVARSRRSTVYFDGSALFFYH